MTRRDPPARLYLVPPAQLAPEAFAEVTERALATQAVACLRLDLGAAPEEVWRQAAALLRPMAEAQDVPLVIAEHYRLVEPLGLDGVHLGSSRTPVREVRKALGADRVVGVFAGASRHVGMTVAEAGADYVSLGPVGAVGALGDGTRADDDLFEWWAEVIETPVVAEGGVTVEDSGRLANWADFVVPEAGVWEAPEGIEAALERYAEALGG